MGYTQPQGEPIGVDVSGAVQEIPLQSCLSDDDGGGSGGAT